MKFSIVLILSFSSSVFAENKLFSRERALVGDAIYLGVIAGHGILDEAKRRASNWLNSLSSRVEAEKALSPLALSRQIRDLENQHKKLQHVGMEQERAHIKSELDNLYELINNLVNLIFRRANLFFSGEQTSQKSPTSSQQGSSTTATELSDSPDDDAESISESDLPSIIERQSSRASSIDPEDYPELQTREWLKYSIHDALNHCEEYSIPDFEGMRGVTLSGTSFTGVSEDRTPAVSSEPVSVESRISILVDNIERFITESTQENQRFELNVPGRATLIVWVTREAGDEIRVELVSKEIGKGGRKVCHQSLAITTWANLNLIGGWNTKKEAFLRFPMAPEGACLANAKRLLEERIQPDVLSGLRLAGRLDLSRTYDAMVETRETLFRGSLDALAESLSQDQILVILQDIAEVLNTLHISGLVHRDVKPANIMVNSEGRGFLTDISDLVAWETPDDLSIVCTRGFISKLASINPVHDIYALAETVRRLLPGYLQTEIQALMQANQAIETWLKGDGQNTGKTLRDSENAAERAEAYREFTKKFPAFEAFLKAMLKRF